VHISKLPIPVQQEQVGATEVPDKQPPAKTEPEATQPQVESKTVQTEIGRPQIVKPPSVKPPSVKSAAKLSMAAQPQMPDKASVDTRAKKDIPETPAPYYEESGGVSQKEIPTLLKMAQAD